jgi:hypothetical protein
MLDGILDSAPAIRSVQSFSPTRYTEFLECPLRAVWSANGASALLPVSPSARIGRVAHALLQEAGEGRFVSLSATIIDDRWRKLVSSEESNMEKAWLDRSFVPLRTTVPQYEVRRIQSCKRALEITREVATCKQEIDSSHKDGPQYGFELCVSSCDGIIRGRIDSVLPSAAGPVIRDYKSGVLFENGEQGIVKREYDTQVKLYAALYESSHGRWPAALEIVSVTGSTQAIAFDPIMCADLLSRAIGTVESLNQTIQSGKDQREVEKSLARPSARNCYYCQYRPGCAPYRQIAAKEKEGDNWPKDIIGQAETVQQLGNSKYMITVPTATGLVRIRGLDPSARRHPAIPQLTSGDTVGAFDLCRTAENAFIESLYTTIYKLIS